MNEIVFDTIQKASEVLEEGGLRTKGIFKSSKKNKPLITVITAVLNNEKYLEESIKSLHCQEYDNYEHIIIDGGSTDNTINIIKKYESKIDYWCSKKDKGIYDAFNLGMKLSNGDYIGFLNSDDCYTENALKILLKYIKNYQSHDFIFGSVKKHWGILHGYKPYKIYWSWGFYSSHSTGFFIKKSSAKIVGLYNLKYKFSSDYDYFFRMIVKKKLKGIATKKNEIFGIFRRGGFSSKISFVSHFFEEIQIRIDNGQNKILILLIFIYKFIKHFKKIK
tara:strand:+ start:331 stop:1161 length:831 start_codon:yes stop_codon:yes gene_type:complete